MTETSDRLSFGTLAVHAGERQPLPKITPSVTPIYATSTFVSENSEALDQVMGGTAKSYVYSRFANPTVQAMELAVNALEGGWGTAAFGSGMAALHAALLLAELHSGDVVLAARDLYGATHTLLNNYFGGYGIETRYIDCTNESEVRTALQQEPKPRAVVIEPLTNPLIKVTDVEAVAKACKEAGAMLIVDSTFASPYLLNPLALGADVVVHSATKYLSGHGDTTSGTVTVANLELADSLRRYARLLGAVLSPFDANLVHRGIKTLHLRMRQHSQNAMAVAQWLSEQPGVSAVHYPGLPSHAGHEIATRLFRKELYGGMLAFELRDAQRKEVHRFMDALALVVPVTTLGDVYTEVSYPVMSSHRDWSAGLRKRTGITDGLLRLSIGIEDANDIIEDIDQAIRASA